MRRPQLNPSSSTLQLLTLPSLQSSHLPDIEERHSVSHPSCFSSSPVELWLTCLPRSYVGTLYEINSNESTVSLENVRSHGTEGRKSDASEEVSASDQVYDFIVFRGSDVKDLRIEEGPAAPKENQPPPMPNDPAIVGVSLCSFSIAVSTSPSLPG